MRYGAVGIRLLTFSRYAKRTDWAQPNASALFFAGSSAVSDSVAVPKLNQCGSA